MARIKKSFLSNLLGQNAYDDLRGIAKPITLIGSCILIILFLLSFIVHWRFVSKLLSMVTGTSLLFLFYIAAIILLLDIQVDVIEPDGHYVIEPDGHYRFETTHSPKTINYKLTIFWGVILLLLGVSAIYFSNRYRKQYAFECSTILVDHKAGIYHLKWIEDCEVAAESEDLEEMKGYEINGMGYSICEWCEEYAEEVEYASDTDSFYRR